MKMKSYIPNVITVSRILFALLMLLVPTFSTQFWVFYVYGGISDMLDGFVARRFELQNDLGARLDSISDLVFLVVVIIVFAMNLELPIWIWCIAGVVAVTRALAYMIGVIRFHRYVSLHTYGNKIAGLILFVAPMVYCIVGINITAIMVGLITEISAFEEIFIVCRMKSIDRDCRSFFNYI